MPAAAPPQLVVLDTETTGLDPERDRIIDIGAVRLGPDLDVRERFVTLVDPGVPIPLFITRLVGITDADLRGAPAFPQAFADLREFAGDAVLVGHNAGFDRSVLNACCATASNSPAPHERTRAAGGLPAPVKPDRPDLLPHRLDGQQLLGHPAHNA